MSSRPTATRIIQAALSSAFALSTTLAVPAGAFAAVSDTSVVNTGDDVTVDTTTSQNTSVNVSNSNDATIIQSFTSTSNTGGNSAEGNIGGSTSIDTGNAMSVATFEASGNHNLTGISGLGSSAGVNMVDIVNSGDNADIDSSLNSNLDIGVSNTNTANVIQNFLSISDTGNNTASNNITTGSGGGASIETGNSSATADFAVDVNHNTSALNIGSLSPALGSSTLVTNTGDNADIDSTSDATTNISVDNSNAANISQLLFATANTGNNSGEDNIGNGPDINTGTAAAVGEFMVEGNHNMTGIGGSLTNSPNLNLMDIVNSGDNLSSNTTHNASLTTAVSNTNSLMSASVFTSTSNTGENSSDDNIGSSSLWSGSAGAGGEMASAGNHNQTIFGSVADVLLLWLLGSN